ncbi:MAG: hypothetical protein LBQ50_13910 [Planctomycetaceae bacterium]|jgi:hypothetical protein|nr:hypothetical protein [Planctomycetaceae bacterium]
MKKHLLGLTLILSAFLGCTSRYQYEVDQSLLLQENRRLENALYVTHAQLVDLKRENESLRNTTLRKSNASLPQEPLTRPKRIQSPPVENYDEAPPFEPPEIIIPNEIPGSNAVPDSLKSSQILLPKIVLSSEEKSPPVWSPTR